MILVDFDDLEREKDLEREIIWDKSKKLHTHTNTIQPLEDIDSSNWRGRSFSQKMNGGPSGFSTFICRLYIFFWVLKIEFFSFFEAIGNRLFANNIFLLPDNAPVTRTIVIVSALFTIIFGIQGRSRNLGWSYQVLFLFSFELVFLF